MAFVLMLTTATVAMAQSDVPGPGMEDGIVAQVDTAAGVVKLQDARCIAWSKAPSSSSRDTRLRSVRSSPATTSRSATPSR
jgi:hypothetical protein